MALLDLTSDAVALTAAVCDIPSVSGDERTLADAVETALRGCPHLRVERDGDAVVARTSLGRGTRVVVAGHLDTVPLAAGSLPTRLEDGVLHGRGTVDMKGGVAVALHLAATVAEPVRDVTWVFYDHEEVEAARNGLGRIARTHPEWLEGDFAILMEPSDGVVEGGCNGTLRATISVPGVTAHSARAWMGRNAIHDAAEVLARLQRYEPRTIEVDGLAYREGLNAVAITGGIAGNVIPDSCVVTVNYRFAPAWSVEEAEAHVREVFAGFAVEVTDSAPGARPGLDSPAAAAFVAAVGGEPKPKYGWTDVARFSALGVPAVNYGPGDPLLAHKDDERVPVQQITDCAERLRAWLTTP
ncbi:succinyldiaminopimelate desuccinylase [Motilibacter rhizosphaerae]|uniref:Succinyl-diaminopimelate desuccinylase n=1 Tax=Motilibacter rhizosphaerae TaxID=598652 RepID=A0A4Q7NQH3_9ACTN|nr:succinyl-diaminopimelate desuccinylase [Motilibacter rhizosphaerae]RZS87256.1 succinyldiaminopimelate desuccinylase [Motilibacter rhizosphaerae]